jgi:adenylosuccinate lyase
MPHKKNPVSTENLTGIARILKSHSGIALENIVLWHERDISHSSTERLYLPDNFGLLHYSLKRLKSTIDNLVIHTDEIERKVSENFSYLSSYYLHYLINHSDLTREEIYKIVQDASFKAESKGDMNVFFLAITDSFSDRGIKINLPMIDFEEIRKIYLKHIDKIFERAQA